MKQTDCNWLQGYHTAWERELHRHEAMTEPEQGLSLAWRKGVVDNAVRKLGSKANDIVSCEICQERIAEHTLNGTDPFDERVGVRESLAAYGVKIPQFGKRNRLPNL